MAGSDKERVIDRQGFRPNVGIVIASEEGRVLWGRRVGGHDSWQFPQGGIHGGETPEQAMYRELDEEVGLKPEHVTVLGETREWLRYRLPERYIRKREKPVCIGQKQRWFLMRFDGPDSAIDISGPWRIPQYQYLDRFEWDTALFPKALWRSNPEFISVFEYATYGYCPTAAVSGTALANTFGPQGPMTLLGTARQADVSADQESLFSVQGDRHVWVSFRR